MASIRERNGRFCVIYSYTDAEGKRRQRWETFATKGEANRRKKEVEYKMSSGGFTVQKCTYFRELLKEYVSLYGKDRWAMSTYDRNTSLIRNYILPVIGDAQLQEVNTRFLEKYYKKLLTIPAVLSPYSGKARKGETVGTSTVRDVHKLIRSCFEQAVKWELVDKNPALYATVPKHKSETRDIWTAETLMNALEVCDDKELALALNLSFSASLRMGELLGLTWDCVDISEEAIATGRACVNVTKELQRISKEALKELDGKDIILVFPEESPLCKTVRVLKTPKTESSIRRVFLPKTVAEMLKEQKNAQEELKKFLGSQYRDYNLVMTTSFGMPEGDTVLRKKLKTLIREYNLPDIVFHSIRHTSVTYKLKLNGGDIKSVQGDSGHAQVNMVTDVYSHIIDEDRRRNAQLFEEAFYGKKNLTPKIDGGMNVANSATLGNRQTLEVPEGIDAELLVKVLANPEMAALLSSLAGVMGGSK